MTESTTSNSRMIPIPNNIRCRTESRSRLRRDKKVLNTKSRSKASCLTDLTFEPDMQSLVFSDFADELTAEAAVKFRIGRRHCGSKPASVYVFEDLHSRLRKFGYALCLRSRCKLT